MTISTMAKNEALGTISSESVLLGRVGSHFFFISTKKVLFCATVSLLLITFHILASALEYSRQ